MCKYSGQYIGKTHLLHEPMIYRIINKTIVVIFMNFVLIEMREKLHSQRETVISLLKSWDLIGMQRSWLTKR